MYRAITVHYVFTEKNRSGTGLINAGVYLIDKSLFNQLPLPKKFSFESDFIAAHFDTLEIIAFEGVEDFIDIGVPEDYILAQTKVPQMADDFHQ